MTKLIASSLGGPGRFVFCVQVSVALSHSQKKGQSYPGPQECCPIPTYPFCPMEHPIPCTTPPPPKLVFWFQPHCATVKNDIRYTGKKKSSDCFFTEMQDFLTTESYEYKSSFKNQPQFIPCTIFFSIILFLKI